MIKSYQPTYEELKLGIYILPDDVLGMLPAYL